MKSIICVLLFLASFAHCVSESFHVVVWSRICPFLLLSAVLLCDSHLYSFQVICFFVSNAVIIYWPQGKISWGAGWYTQQKRTKRLADKWSWSPDHTTPEAHATTRFFSYLSHCIPLLFKLGWAGFSVTCSWSHSNCYRRLGRKGPWGGWRNATEAYTGQEEVRSLGSRQIGKGICECISRPEHL